MREACGVTRGMLCYEAFKSDRGQYVRGGTQNECKGVC